MKSKYVLGEVKLRINKTVIRSSGIYACVLNKIEEESLDGIKDIERYFWWEEHRKTERKE